MGVREQASMLIDIGGSEFFSFGRGKTKPELSKKDGRGKMMLWRPEGH